LRSDVLGIGIIVVIAGGIAYAYTQQANFFGATVTVGYPYRDLGTALIVLGVVALIIGAAMKQEVAIPQATVGTAARSPAKFCSSCGQMLRPADVFCPRCGQKAV